MWRSPLGYGNMSSTYFFGRSSPSAPARNGASSSHRGSHLSWTAKASYASRSAVFGTTDSLMGAGLPQARRRASSYRSGRTRVLTDALDGATGQHEAPSAER